MKYFLILLALLIFANEAYSQDEKWFQIDIGNKDSYFFYDTENVLFDRVRDHVTIPTRRVFLTDIYNNGKLVEEKLEKIRIYCERKSFLLLETKYVYKDGTEESKVENIFYRRKKESLILSYSYEEALYVILCR
jgi:hypothetical protein